MRNIMGVNLMSTLGLDKVEADPNAIPDGRYDGVVKESAYVISKTKDKLLHIITFAVTEGDNKGASIGHVSTLGEAPRNASGEQAQNIEEMVGYTPTMSDSQKSWYKKVFVDLGIAEQDVPNTGPEDLVGIAVTFGVKKNGSYRNVNFMEPRAAAAAPAPVSLAAGIQTAAPAAAAPVATATGLAGSL